MPLLTMSPNVQESGRKRTHGDFLDGGFAVESEEIATGEDHGHPTKSPNFFSLRPTENIPPRLPFVSHPSPPEQNSPASMTDAGSSTPTKNSPSPNLTPSKEPAMHHGSPMPLSQASSLALDAVGQPIVHHPPVKRKKLTAEEKAAKLETELARKRERDAKLQASLEKKKEMEEAKAVKAVEKAKIDAEKKARADEREEKRKQKEEEERKAKDEKDKKAKSQLRLNSFFTKGPGTPKKSAAAGPAEVTIASSPIAEGKQLEPGTKNDYERMFQPFFVKESVVLASSRYAMDEETRTAKAGILDEYLQARPEFGPKPFDPVATFHLAGRPKPRGRKQLSVRKIMADAARPSGNLVDLTRERQNAQMKQLTKISMKYLFYREDVRPAYYGTITSQSSEKLRMAAKRPTARCLPTLNYDYDSEAEWVDDEGEDVLEDGEDEEEEPEDEDMAEFLDDSEDLGPARAAFLGAMEPETTGLCFEDPCRKTPCEKMRKFRLEVILESLDIHAQINPFSTAYWEPEPKPTKGSAKGVLAGQEAATTAAQNQGTAYLNPWLITGTGQQMPPPPLPGAVASTVPTGDTATLVVPSIEGVAQTPTTTAVRDPRKMVRPERLVEFRTKLMQFSHLSKVGLIELLSADLGCTRAQVKYTLETLAENLGGDGKGRKKNAWRLKDGWTL